jgi:ubiquinone/menaquinone biosynthesis C-methylase UbiE
MARRLSREEIARLDPYQLMAVLGKRVIHPGGRGSTEELLALADIRAEHEVIEIGCGVGTTAIEIARRYGARVIATDIDDAMLDEARRNVDHARLSDLVTVEQADVLELPFADESFDRVVVEAVTMFVDRDRAAREVARVCRPGGIVLDHEFIWRSEPPLEARRVFEGEVCPGIAFDTAEDWRALYERTGFRDIELRTGPFTLMRPTGFVRDEGVRGSARFVARLMSRPAYVRKMLWLMRRIVRSMRHLGYVVVAARKVA